MAQSHWHIKLTITVISKWWDYEFKFAFGTLSMIMYYCFFMCIICIIRKSNTFFLIVRKKICFRKSSITAWNWAHIYHYRFLVHCVSYVCWCMFVPISSVQSLSRVRLFVTPWIAACKASLSITNSQSSLRLTSIESVMPSSHLILSSPSPAPNPSQHQSLSNESTLRMRWPKY